MAAFTLIKPLHSHANGPSCAKSWMDFLEGSMSPKEEVGCLSRTGMWWDTTLHHLWATNRGREKVACRKKWKENVKRDLCRSPKKLKKHENNQILACCRTAVFPYKIHFALFFISRVPLPGCSCPAFSAAHLLAWSFSNVTIRRALGEFYVACGICEGRKSSKFQEWCKQIVAVL